MITIEWKDFEAVEIRAGTILSAEPNPKAKKPAYILRVDLGDLGIKTSSAQITHLYKPEQLIDRQVICVCNFEPKNIAGIVSEILVTGFYNPEGHVVL